MRNCSNASNTMISTGGGGAMLAVAFGFSPVGSVFLGIAIGYYFYRYEKEQEKLREEK